jgi:hypothetical protein
MIIYINMVVGTFAVFDKLQQNRSYSILGLQHENAMPVIDQNCSPTLSQSKYCFSVDSTQSYTKIYLPFPAGFRHLRCASVPEPTHENISTVDCTPTQYHKSSGKQINVTRVSLCQALTYHVPDFSQVQIPETNWVPKIDKETSTANLHFWAEPPHRLTDVHAENAYARLNDLLPPLNLRLLVYYTPPLDRDTGVCGMPPQEEQGWADWASNGAEGTHPTNCCAVMATK